MKPRVYIETSVISYLTARPSNDFRAMSNQNVTLEWWELERPKFELVISEFVIAEASLGHPEAAQKPHRGAWQRWQVWLNCKQHKQ